MDNSERLFGCLSCHLQASLQAHEQTPVLEARKGLKLTAAVTSGLQKGQSQILAKQGLFLHFLKECIKFTESTRFLPQACVSFQSGWRGSFKTLLM